MNLFLDIISEKNIEKAYFDTVFKFDKKIKSNKYYGYDGKKLSDYDLFSNKLISQIKNELENKTIFEDALKVLIPKKNKPGFREIYIHNAKERIKAQAIFQIIEPVFNSFFSNYLFSYRTSHPQTKALKKVIRAYKKRETSHILVGDLSNYSDNIDKNILISKLKKFNLDKDTETLVLNSINNSYIEKGQIHKKEKGFITGLPITLLFNNLYLDDLDKKIGPQSFLYRRVGDDFIIFDSLEKLEKLQNEIKKDLKKLDIPEDKQKIQIISIEESFTFLGYHFSNQIISIPEFSLKKIKAGFRRRLKYYPVSNFIKIKRLKNIFYGKYSMVSALIEIINQYRFVNNQQQIKELSNYFFIRLVIYFWNSYNSKLHKKTLNLLKEIKIPSLFMYYVYIHTGKYTLEELRKNRKI